jgi:small-conductance mechanosensitive channel
MFEQQIQQLKNDLDEARRTPQTVGTDEDLRRELDDMTRDARGASAEAASLRTQLANALSFAAQVAPIPPQQQEERGQKIPDSPDFF